MRVIRDDDLRGVNPGEHVRKDRFVIVDCVYERDKTDYRPMDKNKVIVERCAAPVRAWCARFRWRLSHGRAQKCDLAR